jgi:osomolarity two-component system sensor histidine kinase SLN1
MNVDASSVTDFQLVVESADNSVGGKIYSNGFEQILYYQNNQTSFSNISFPSDLFPLDNQDHENSTELEEINQNANGRGYMRGPFQVNNLYFLSFTQPIVKNSPDFENTNLTFNSNIVGYLTIVSQASSLLSVTKTLNLEDGSRMALISVVGGHSRGEGLKGTPLNYTFVFPSNVCSVCYGLNFGLKRDSPSFLALINATWGSVLSYDLTGYGKTAVGYAPVSSISQIWGVLIFQAHSVMYAPIRTLRDILLASVFAIGVGVCIATFFLSGWVVKPIIRLRAATEQSTNSNKPLKEQSLWRFYRWIFNSHCKDSQLAFSQPSSTGSEFRIPEKVVTRKYIKDELTELTETFNEMTSELRKQYTVLEERVVQRTKEIKTAKVLAETANEAKSLFIANITHELRTPLNGILGMAAVSMDETNPDSIREALKVIFKSGELLLRLLTDLLSFSKSQVDNMKLEPKGFKLSEVTSQLHAIFDEQSKLNHTFFTIKMDSPFLDRLELLGDLNRILQVIMNLVSNSLKFTQNNGHVNVTISGTVHKLKDGTSVDSLANYFDIDPLLHNLESVILTVVVEDDGPGIAPHLQSRVFEPFVQGDLALSEKRGGVGLGLSICRQLTQMMNGELSLKSELGVGTEFFFVVPLKVISILELPSVPVQPVGIISQPKSFAVVENESSIPEERSIIYKAPATTNSKSDKFSFSKLSVLIAEDNRVNQEVLVRMLKLEGLQNVTVAKNGSEAVEAVKVRVGTGSSFDIIFMDIQMPILDGIQATEVIRKELAFTGTIIAVSAFTDTSNIDECLAVGMDHFLAKPLRRPQLHSLLIDLDHCEAV